MKKILPACLAAAAVVIEVVALIVYGCTGVSVFSAELSPAVFATGIISILVCAFAAAAILLGLFPKVLPQFLKHILFIGFVLAMMAFFYYICAQVNYLASIFVGIDGTEWTPEFISTVALTLIAWASALASSIVYNPAKEVENV